MGAVLYPNPNHQTLMPNPQATLISQKSPHSVCYLHCSNYEQTLHLPLTLKENREVAQVLSL